jgi:hypothetical protein
MEIIKTACLVLVAAALIALLWATAGPVTAILLGVVFVIAVAIIAFVTARRSG